MVEQNKSRKVYVLDTNVIVHDPYAYKNFEGVHIGIPAMVLEELDSFKKEGTDRGRNAREFIRELDALRERGSLKEGVPLENGSIVKVLFIGSDLPDLPFRMEEQDNRILLAALGLVKEGYEVKFISKDLNARVKADALGIESQDYLKEHVSEEEFYKGWISLDVPAVDLTKDEPGILKTLPKEYDLTLNEFVLLQSQNNPHNNRVFRYVGADRFLPIYAPKLKWPLEARNAQQLMALNLLMDDTIPFVTLLGPAGTGKTFLALLAGLYKTIVKDDFRKLMVSRPVVPLGKDIGYLPGTLEEKLHSWMLPIYDNLELIMHSVKLSDYMKEDKDDGKHYRKERGHGGHGRGRNGDGRHRDGRHEKHTHRNNYKERAGTGVGPVDALVNKGKLSLEAITYMRGRSIPYQFILIDESQNLTPHEVKTIVTRVGEGSKIVLVGDPYQIDSPYLDFSSNGLVTASERFKGQRLFGAVYLPTSERSELSKLAGQIL